MAYNTVEIGAIRYECRLRHGGTLDCDILQTAVRKKPYRKPLSQFRAFVKYGHIGEFLRDVDLPANTEQAFKRRLSEIARVCLDISDKDRLATRDDLYARFVVADGTPTAQGKYDRNKPFAAAVKQFLDLDYM